MKAFGIIAIVLILTVFAAVYSANSGTKAVDASVLSVETIFAAAGLEFNDVLQDEIVTLQDLFATQGFMALYREVYRVSLATQRYNFEQQLAAVSVLLSISHGQLDPGPLQNCGKQLFVHFCRLSLLDALFAIEMAKLEAKLNIFSLDVVLKEFWHDYLHLVWSKVLLPEYARQQKISSEMKEFIELLPEFNDDLKRLRVEKLPETGKKLDFFLKKGTNGSKQSDYELREIDLTQDLE